MSFEDLFYRMADVYIAIAYAGRREERISARPCGPRIARKVSRPAIASPTRVRAWPIAAHRKCRYRKISVSCNQAIQKTFKPQSRKGRKETQRKT